MALQNFTLKVLKEVISKNLSVPFYQREYSWDKGEWDDLWNDLNDTKNSEDSYKHFFGQIVIHSNDNFNHIIDGQQRITTAVILLSVLIHKLYECYNALEAQNMPLLKKIIACESCISEEIDFTGDYRLYKLYLTQNTKDDEFFRKVVFNFEFNNKKSSYPSQEKMRKAYRFFDKKITDTIKDITETSEKLNTLFVYTHSFINRFVLMYIEATELNEAFTIFETLNARGKDLASADLLKNHIFSKSPNNIDNLNQQWVRILDALNGQSMTKFIKSYWNSTHEFVREKNLYKIISSSIKNQNQSIEFINKLEDSAGIYQSLCNPYASTAITDVSILDALRGLNTLKASTYYPILLAMFIKTRPDGTRMFTNQDITLVTQTIESYIFKNIIICGNNPNSTEILFAKIAKQIAFNELDDAQAIKESIDRHLEKEEVLKTSFLNLSFEGDKDIVRYFFRKIHKHLDQVHEINIDNTEVHIEHIMPVNKTKWDNITDEMHHQNLWKIGNLCLLSGTLNEEISNNTFEYKKEKAYSLSQIKPNDELLEYNVWNDETINNRAEKLFNYLKEIWK